MNKSNKKKNWERGKTQRESPGRVVLRPPRQRLRRLFATQHDVAQTIEQLMLQLPSPGPSMPQKIELLFEVAVVERALNLLKSVLLLCGEGHWEVAASANRQLFELLINMEYVALQPDRSAAKKRFMRFGLMQYLEQAVASLEYSVATNRPIDTSDLADVKQALSEDFNEFRKKKGARRDATWTGLNARQLAELSAERLRKDQYRLLYGTWSEQAHGAPGALLGRILQVQETEAELVANDDVHITLAVAMSVELVVAVMDTLPGIPGLPPGKRNDWFKSLE